MIPIVVVSWNHLETTTATCLGSIRRFTGRRYRVLCVDNGSTDGTPRWLERLSRRDPRFEPILLAKNLGWSGGVLEGMTRVTEAESCLCLLNSDTIVTPRWLDKLHDHLRAHPGAAVISPREIALSDGALPESGSTPRLAGVAPLARPGTAPPPEPVSLERVLEVSLEVERRFRGRVAEGMPSGYCALVDRSAFPRLRDYLEDFELFRRKERDVSGVLRGLKCLVALDTFVHHARGGSGGYFDYRGE